MIAHQTATVTSTPTAFGVWKPRASHGEAGQKDQMRGDAEQQQDADDDRRTDGATTKSATAVRTGRERRACRAPL